MHEVFDSMFRWMISFIFISSTALIVIRVVAKRFERHRIRRVAEMANRLDVIESPGRRVVDA